MLSYKPLNLLSYFFFIVFLNGCSFHPVYLSVNSPKVSIVEQKLLTTKVLVIPQSRSAVYLSNLLNYKLNTGNRSNSNQYTLNIKLSLQNQSSGISPSSGLATNVFVSAIAEYEIVDIISEKILYTGKTFSRSDYDASAQRFANNRALIDAENRAISLITDNIYYHLVGFFSQYKGM